MKASELIQLLEKYPEFEVELCFNDADLEQIYADRGIRALPLKWINVIGVADIGHSDKIIILDGVQK